MQGDLHGLQTPLGARSSRNQTARLTIPGRPLRWMVTQVIELTGQNPAYRLTHRHLYRFPHLDNQQASVLDNDSELHEHRLARCP